MLNQPILRRNTLFLAAIVLSLAVFAPAGQAARDGRVIVSGRVLDGAGMTLMAVAPDGSAIARVLDAKGQFRLTLPARTAGGTTLQLVRRRGTYFGPIVLARRGHRAFSALSGRNVNLGVVTLRRGWAFPKGSLPTAVFDPAHAAAAAATGRPLGAGRLGLVRMPTVSKRSTSVDRSLAGQGAPTGEQATPGDDPDADGIPSVFDADDNGNLVLDTVDPASPENGASSAGLFSTLFLGFAQALNANAVGVAPAASEPADTGTSADEQAGPAAEPNAAGPAQEAGATDVAVEEQATPGAEPSAAGPSQEEDEAADPGTAAEEPAGPTDEPDVATFTQQAIDTAVSSALNLVFFFDEGRFAGRTITSAHVDCFNLPYCRPGDGTSILGGVTESSPSLPRGSRWVDYSPDGSGHPNLERISANGGYPSWVAGVQPRVTTAGIHPGDVFSVVFASDAGPITVPTSLSGYFVSTPAISTYTSGGGEISVSYPVSAGVPGTPTNPAILSSTRLTLTFWRPQRQAIPGAESGSFIDMGHLRYGVVPNVAGASREFGCSGFYSSLSPTLSVVASSPDPSTDLFPVHDSAGDSAPDRASTLSLTVDLGACLAARGIDPAGRTLDLTLTAASEPRPGGMDRAAQTFSVRLPG